MKKKIDSSVAATALYGRARRIELAEKSVYVFVTIVSIILVFVIVGKQNNNVEINSEFADLRRYLEDSGFRCESIHRAGGICTINHEKNHFSFIRYDTGFEYIARSDGYVLSIKSTEETGSSITIRTYSEALPGYRNRSFNCEYKDSIIGELDYCKDDSLNELDSDVYLGIVQKGMYDVKNILYSSGFNVDTLIKRYKWTK